jgi:Ca-activated chloride channel family protein
MEPLMTFLVPLALLLFLPIATIAATYVVMLRRRRKYAVRFAALPMLDKVVPNRPAWRRHVPTIALMLALAALVFAIARPEIPVKIPRERATVIVAIDTSASMQARDVDPTRMRAAIDAAVGFIDELPETFNVGVVAFSDTAELVSAPSTDRNAAKASLRSLDVSSATAIGEAVFSSLDAIESVAEHLPTDEEQASTQESGEDLIEELVPGRVVLLSDGSNTVGRTPAEAALASVAADVQVSTIAYGTPDGVLETGPLDSIPVPVDTETLNQLAEDTGGQAYTAQSSDELEEVYRDIGSSIGYRTEYREITVWFSVSALVLGLLAAALSMRWFSRMI